jgi:hypothetical protein
MGAPMRGLALARYQFLSRLRASYGIVAVLMIVALLPLLRDTLFMSSFAEWRDIEINLIDRSQNVTLGYFLHVLVLLVACDLFGTPRPARDGVRQPDLTETAPIRPGERFFGDAAGIFQCAAALHLCALPALALGVALSPLPTATFFWLEGAVLLALVFGSASGSWKLRGSGPWMRTRSARSATLFFILLLTTVILNTRWERFRDSALNSVIHPSPRMWAETAAAIDSVPGLVGSVFALYAGYVIYFAVSSIRAIERGQETAHAL